MSEPSPPPTRPQARNYWHIAAAMVAILFLLASANLARLQARGPVHQDFDLPGYEPATMYLPGGGRTFYRLFPPPQAELPPAVVLVHGFSGDREIMSTLARRIAQNGYAVLTIDARGHGANRNPFSQGIDSSALRRDVGRAVRFLRHYNMVDGGKIVVMGHSMGAGAALDYATHDPNLAGSVMISGGWNLGPVHPRNALFVFAQRDPDEAIQQTSKALAAHLAGTAQIELGKTYGDFAQGTAIEAVRIPGVDHVGIISSPQAAATIIHWLDSVFARPRAGAIDLADPRRAASGVAMALLLILLVPIGRIAGTFAGQWPERPAGREGWIGIAVMAGALVAAMPLVTAVPPAATLSLVTGDSQISWFAVAGLIMVAGLLWYGRVGWDRVRERVRERSGAVLFASLLGFAAIYVGFNAVSITFHRLALTPERAVFWILATLLILPFWFGFELLVRHGGLAVSTAHAVIGRIAIVLLMALGVVVGVLPFVLILMLPSIALLFVMIEIFAASAYSASRNLALIAIVESAWFVWIIAAISPITFMF
jgi:LPXTG-motif cell wall-anchored protein